VSWSGNQNGGLDLLIAASQQNAEGCEVGKRRETARNRERDHNVGQEPTDAAVSRIISRLKDIVEYFFCYA
jgi:hypothetical protein